MLKHKLEENSSKTNVNYECDVTDSIGQLQWINLVEKGTFWFKELIQKVVFAFVQKLGERSYKGIILPRFISEMCFKSSREMVQTCSNKDLMSHNSGDKSCSQSLQT